MGKQRKTTAAHADARRKSIAKNRRARYDYEVLEELECGIARGALHWGDACRGFSGGVEGLQVVSRLRS